MTLVAGQIVCSIMSLTLVLRRPRQEDLEFSLLHRKTLIPKEKNQQSAKAIKPQPFKGNTSIPSRPRHWKQGMGGVFVSWRSDFDFSIAISS